MRPAIFSFATIGAMLSVGFLGVHTSSAHEAPSKHDRQPAAEISSSMPEGYPVDVDDDFGVGVQSSPSSDKSDRGTRPSVKITPILVSQFPPLRSKAGECTKKKATEGSWKAANTNTGVRAFTNAKAAGKCDVDVTRTSSAIPVPTPYSSAEIEVDVVFVCKGELVPKSLQTGLTADLINSHSVTCEASLTVKPINGPATVIPFKRSFRLPTNSPSFEHSFRTKEVIPLPRNSSSLEITLRTYSRSIGDGDMKSVAVETSITNAKIRLHHTR
jgi:hypothetical protein